MFVQKVRTWGSLPRAEGTGHAAGGRAGLGGRLSRGAEPIEPAGDVDAHRPFPSRSGRIVPRRATIRRWRRTGRGPVLLTARDLKGRDNATFPRLPATARPSLHSAFCDQDVTARLPSRFLSMEVPR